MSLVPTVVSLKSHTFRAPFVFGCVWAHGCYQTSRPSRNRVLTELASSTSKSHVAGESKGHSAEPACAPNWESSRASCSEYGDASRESFPTRISHFQGPNSSSHGPGPTSHWLSGWPQKSPNFIFTTKMIFPKSLKFMNSGSET